jgi:hypothetical protein
MAIQVEIIKIEKRGDNLVTVVEYELGGEIVSDKISHVVSEATTIDDVYTSIKNKIRGERKRLDAKPVALRLEAEIPLNTPIQLE